MFMMPLQTSGQPVQAWKRGGVLSVWLSSIIAFMRLEGLMVLLV